MNFLANQETYLRVTEFLKDQIKDKGYTWDTEKMKPMDAEMYANAKIEVGGTQDLLTGASQEVRGVTNFNGNQLVKGRAFVGLGVALGFAIDDENKEVHEVKYNYKGGANVPPFLMHATLVLKQKDEIVVKLPVAAIYNGGASVNNFYRELGALSLLEDDSIVELQLEFPKGAKQGDYIEEGQKLFISAYFKGLETYLKR